MKETLRKLLMAFGPSGRENAVRKVISDEIAPYVDSMRVDALGNLIAVKKGPGKRVMVAAHMDQIGFIVTNAEESGFLRVHNVGGIYRKNSLNRRVVFENGLSGILSTEIEDEDPADKTMLKLFIDIGAKNREEALRLVAIGDCAVYAPEMNELQNGLISAPAMDNRVGCAVLVEAIRQFKPGGNALIAVFTAQEEVGIRGAKAAAYDVDPDVGLAIDVTTAGDTPKGHRIEVFVGKGPAVKLMDSYIICSPAIVDALEETARGLAMPVQREILTAGGNDAAAIQLSRGGVPSGTLSIPCRYVHSAVEVISLEDAENAAKLTAAFAEAF